MQSSCAACGGSFAAAGSSVGAGAFSGSNAGAAGAFAAPASRRETRARSSGRPSQSVRSQSETRHSSTAVRGEGLSRRDTMASCTRSMARSSSALVKLLANFFSVASS